MSFRLVQDKMLTYTLAISQPISTIDLGDSTEGRTTSEINVSVTPTWYCSGYAYSFVQGFEDLSLAMKVNTTEEWSYTLPSLAYETIDNSYCPITVQVKICPIVSSNTELNPSEDKRTYYSAWDVDAVLSMLDSRNAWSAGTSDIYQWLTIDAEQEYSIAGITIQGKSISSGYESQFVTSVKLAYSSDNSNWTEVQEGRVFQTEVQQDTGDGTRYEVLLDEPV
jgi:hypothetical protein